MKKSSPRTSTIIKYHQVLTELYMVLKNTNRINMEGFVEKHRLTKGFPVYARTLNFLQKSGSGTNANWTWIASEPTKKMATDLLQEASKQALISKGKTPKHETQKPKVLIPNNITHDNPSLHYELNLFFGLIKIKKHITK